MSIDLIQFQQGRSMTKFMQRYRMEAKAYRALCWLQRSQGFCCPCCGERRRLRFRRSRQTYNQCRACRHQATLLSGTILVATKLPLRIWLLAIHLPTCTKVNMAALELMRHSGVNYKAAWRIRHKVMQAMMALEAPRQLAGFLQIDDAYLGGEYSGGKPVKRAKNVLFQFCSSGAPCCLVA